MTDTAESFLAEVHTELNRLVGSTTPYSLTGLTKEERQAPPHVAWVEQGGQIAPTRLLGQLGTMVTRWELHVWHTNRENCRALLQNVYRAARNVGYGPNVLWGDYRAPTQTDAEHAKVGELLVADVTIELPIGPEPQQTATTPLTHTHTVTVGGETVC